mgnify:FL=1
MSDSFDTYEFRQAVLTKGRLIGTTAPCAETKGMWWQVYVHDGKVIALGMEHPCGVAFLEPVARHATELPINHLPQYCDDPSVARWAIENEADIRTHPTCLAGRS